MKFAVISDIHANRDAFEAVLADIKSQGIDTIYCLGDVVGYGSEPSACLEMAKAHCDIILMGNHEYYALGLITSEYLSPVAKESAAWTQGQLSEQDLAILSDFQMDATLADIYLVHASPFEPENWRYILATPEAARAFEHLDANMCFYGHSHLPMIFSNSGEGSIRQQIGHDFQPDEEKRYLVNVGSVGQPRDNDPRASYVSYDVDNRDIHFHRVAYDVENAQKKMRDAGLPSLLVDRLTVGQ